MTNPPRQKGTKFESALCLLAMDHLGEKVTDQLPFGDFTPGRYAWLLTDITPCDPVPAKGRQGLWDWEAPA